MLDGVLRNFDLGKVPLCLFVRGKLGVRSMTAGSYQHAPIAPTSTHAPIAPTSTERPAAGQPASGRLQNVQTEIRLLQFKRILW